MSIITLIGIATLLFVVGSFLIFKGNQQEDEEVQPDEDPDVVPISDPQELDELKEQYAPSSVEQELPNQAQPLSPALKEIQVEKKPDDQEQLTVNENADEDKRLKLQAEIDRLRRQMAEEKEETNSKINELIEERNNVQEALEREISNKETVEPADTQKVESKEQEDQLMQAEGSVVRLTGENQRLQDQLQEKNEKITAYNKEIEALKNQSVQTNSDDQNKIEVLQGELERQKQQLDEAQRADQSTIERLSQEKSMLVESEQNYKERIDSLELKIKDMHNSFLSEVSKLQQESETTTPQDIDQLNRNLLDAQNKHKDISLQLEADKALYEQRINILTEEISQLKQDMALASSSPSNDDSLADSQSKLEALKEEKQKLVTRNEELEQSFTKLKDFNDHLLEKEKTLIYELSKSRAQSLGLEKICEDYKRQSDQNHPI